MRAAVYRGGGRVGLEQVPEPRLPPGGLLVGVRACGLCGSDLMNWYQDRRAPTVLGHEPVGVVLEGAAGGLGPGDRVHVHHHVPCQRCDLCRRGRETLCPSFRRTNIAPGGLAERIAVPAEIAELDVLRLPGEMSDAAASLIEPLGCVLRGQRRADVGPGAAVAVVGCGAMGLLQIAAARAAGAERVVGIEPREERRAVAEAAGATVLERAEPDALAEALGGGLADAVFVCTAAPAAIAEALHLAGPAGLVQLFAPPRPGTPVTLDLGAVWFREVAVESTYSAGPRDTRDALALLAAGAVDAEAIVSHVVALDEVEEAFRLARSGDALKVLVSVSGE
jgi:L-iditol 2-dehydrogenase